MQCSNCNMKIDDGSRFCGFCGSEQATKKCVSCGHEIEGQPAFCPYCGKTTTVEAGQPFAAVSDTADPAPLLTSGIPREAAVGVGWRFAAVLVDGILLFIIGYLLAIVSGQTTQGGFNLQGGPAFLFFLIGMIYYIVMEALCGATVGKMLCGLKVLNTDGSPLDWSASVVRNILRIVDGLLVYLVGAILVWNSPMRQRLGDRVAHTVVVKKSRL